MSTIDPINLDADETTQTVVQGDDGLRWLCGIVLAIVLFAVAGALIVFVGVPLVAPAVGFITSVARGVAGVVTFW